MRDMKAEQSIITIAKRIVRFQRTMRRREHEQKDEHKIDRIIMTATTAGGQIRTETISPRISSSVLYMGTTECSGISLKTRFPPI